MISVQLFYIKPDFPTTGFGHIKKTTTPSSPVTALPYNGIMISKNKMQLNC